MHVAPVRQNWSFSRGICRNIMCCECDLQIELGYCLCLLLVLTSINIMTVYAYLVELLEVQ